MAGFIETKKQLEDSFSIINKIEPETFRIESFEQRGTENCLLVRGSDDFTSNHSVELKFHNVAYISAPIEMHYCTLSIARNEDAMPIQQMLGGQPGWMVCISMSAEGGPPFKFFILAERVEVSTEQVKY
jgi:hypothetical protein